VPIYEYRCATCGEEFQAIRRITDETLPDCPRCRTGQVEKKISLSAFHLKGSGWYKTDYAKDGSGHGGASAPKPADTASTEGSSAPSSSSGGAPASAPAAPAPSSSSSSPEKSSS
jgi:putative FmdB family regulatory protein